MGYCDTIVVANVTSIEVFCEFLQQELGIKQPSKAHVKSLSRFHEKKHEPIGVTWSVLAVHVVHLKGRNDHGTPLQVLKEISAIAMEALPTEDSESTLNNTKEGKDG